MADIDALLEQWLAEHLAERPVRASTLGLTGYDDQLGDFSAAGFERRTAHDRSWASRLAAVPTEGLALDQDIDLELVRSVLAGQEVMEDWTDWRRDPAVYLGPCLTGVFTLFLHRLRPEPELALSASARLRAVPAALDEARANIDPELADRLIVERGLGQCRAGATYCRDLLPAEVADPAARREVADAGELAASALEAFSSHLADLADRARGSWRIGEARYSALLLRRELLGYGSDEMHRRGEAALEKLDAEADELARRIDPAATAWRDVTAALAADHPESPEAMLAGYRRWTGAARQFLVDHQLVTLPEGERCLVEPSPPFQRPILAVASYNGPPPFTPSLTGHFFVPFPPEGTSPADLAERLSDNNHHAMPTIAVHEAYPGHHWHFAWLKANPRPLRRALWTSYFVEGWALYTEGMMRRAGFFIDPRQELCHLEARIFRAARIVVDTGLHAGTMTVDEAEAFMSSRAGLTDAVARAEVSRYCAWPTQASSYLTGALEIERVAEAWQRQSRGDLRSFHDTIARSGGLPIALAERATLGRPA
jgi:uncharacterized protein (DUF885 family)